jgi:hypothetical protein
MMFDGPSATQYFADTVLIILSYTRKQLYISSREFDDHLRWYHRTIANRRSQLHCRPSLSLTIQDY